MSSLLPAALLLAAAAPLPEKPSAFFLSPEMRVARIMGGNLEVEQTVTVYQRVTRTETREVDGKQVAVTVEVAVPALMSQLVTYPLKDVKAATADGKTLDAAALARRLNDFTPVVLLRGEPALPRALRGLLRDDALILALPAAEPMPLPRPKPGLER